MTAEMVDQFVRSAQIFPSTLRALAKDELIARADAARSRMFDVLGLGAVTFTKDFPWTADFIHGFDWGLQPSRRIKLCEGREIKVPWELSRFYHAPILAYAYRETGDRRYLEECLAHMSDWIQKNPLQRGPNWMNAMEAAIRAANWCLALDILRPSLAKAEPPDRYRVRLSRIIMSLDEHGWFIEHHLEYGGTNHEIAGYAGLVSLGAKLSGVSPDADRWLSLGVRGLERCMAEQVYDDGVDFESSVAYHLFATELFATAAIAGRAVNADLSEKFFEKLEKMFPFAHQSKKQSGKHMNFGDNDSGRVHAITSLDTLAQFLFPQRTSQERTSVFFKNAQIAILRSDNFFCAVDAGANGQNGVGGHCHNDVLSFELSFGASDFVIDQGTGWYTFDGDVRNRFRSTRMHSTVMVDGVEQNRIPKKSNGLFWMHDDARPRVVEWQSDGTHDLFSAEHTGFRRLSDPVTHRRSFELLKQGGRLVITDEFFCKAEHSFEWNFPLHPEVTIGKQDQSSFRLTSGDTVVIFSFDPRLAAEIIEIPFSPSYGIITVTRALRFSSRGREPQCQFVFNVWRSL